MSEEKQKEQKSLRSKRAESGDKGNEQRKRYIKVKAFALEKEKDNFSKLFIIHEKENWWKMVGNSAIMFHYDISKRIKIQSKLLSDSDFDAKSEDGVVNIRDIFELDKKLEENKILPLEIKPEYRIYNIGKKYSHSEVEKLKKAKELEWSKINKIILPKRFYPTIYALERELLTKVYFTTRKFEPYTRELIGKQMADKVCNLVRIYSLFSNDKIKMSTEEYFELVEDAVNFITAQMTIVSELRVATTEQIYSILKTAESLRLELERCRVKKI